ncbi:HAD hydrolase-like protein [Patescibacteria group bacterium]|nr:HAD hydrolase-like protein [Patescibacteria group bacterium]
MVFIDWDGTSVTSKYVYYESMVEIFKRHNVRPPDIVKFGNEVAAARTFQEFYEKCGLPGIQESEDTKVRDPYVANNWHRIVPTPGFVHLLHTCRAIGLPVVILSNNSDDIISRKLEEYRLKGYVDRIAGVADKADYLGNLIALEGHNPSEMIHIDDTKEGLLAAKTFGVRTMAFTGGFNTKERLLEADPEFPERRNGTLADVSDCFQALEIIYKLRYAEKERV